jgi:hypothetical protein
MEDLNNKLIRIVQFIVLSRKESGIGTFIDNYRFR